MYVPDMVKNVCTAVSEDRSDSLAKLADHVAIYDGWVSELARTEYGMTFTSRVADEVLDMVVNGAERLARIFNGYQERESPSDLYTLCLLLSCVVYDKCREVSTINSMNNDNYMHLGINKFYFQEIVPLLELVTSWADAPAKIDELNPRISRRLMFLLARVVEVEPPEVDRT